MFHGSRVLEFEGSRVSGSRLPGFQGSRFLKLDGS